MRSLDIISSTTQLAVEAAVRSFTTSESSARDLISTIWYITDHQLESTATVIVAIVDVLEEESKKQELLASWNGFKIQVDPTTLPLYCAYRLFSNGNNFLIWFQSLRAPSTQGSFLAMPLTSGI
jgi:hypothetical protein